MHNENERLNKRDFKHMCNETIQPPEAVSGRFGRESFRSDFKGGSLVVIHL